MALCRGALCQVRRVIHPPIVPATPSVSLRTLTAPSLAAKRHWHSQRVLRPLLPNSYSVAHLSNKPTLPKLEPEDSTRGRIRKHVFFRFLDYLAGYVTNVLDKILPSKAVQFYRLFKDGTKLLLKDMTEFSWVYSVLSQTQDWDKACRTLSRRQLELYMTHPDELKRVMPVLAVSALPMAQNVVFPLALMYPKHLLSIHFWSPEVRLQVEEEAQKQRHLFYRKLLRDLTRSSTSARNHPAYPVFKKTLKKITVKGTHPSPQEILQLQDMFCRKKGIFHLNTISSLHVRHLMKVHGLRDFFWWRHKLTQYANLLRHVDLAILREGGVGYMGDEDMREVCLWRGLNAQEMPRSDMRQYLECWIDVSEQLQPGMQSLLLHLPILLGYNHPSRHWDDLTVT